MTKLKWAKGSSGFLIKLGMTTMTEIETVIITSRGNYSDKEYLGDGNRLE